MLMKNSEKQVLFNKLDAAPDEELHKAMNVKLNRLERVLDKDGIYR